MPYWLLFVCNLSIGCLTQEFNVERDCVAARQNVLNTIPVFVFPATIRKVQAYCQRFER